MAITPAPAIITTAINDKKTKQSPMGVSLVELLRTLSILDYKTFNFSILNLITYFNYKLIRF